MGSTFWLIAEKTEVHDDAPPVLKQGFLVVATGIG